jgi:hypothetical protein
MMDILAHNNWKRPVYFTITTPNENMMGLEKYLYNEGFAYHLLPLKPDTAVATLENSNTLTMYNNIMTKFKWGNMKNARYLDHESLTMFYPLITRIYLNLIDNLVKENHSDLAKNVLRKYMDVMPDLMPASDVGIRKYYMAQNAYSLGEKEIGDKLVNQIHTYIIKTLDYNSILFKDGKTDLKNNDIQLGLSLLNGLVTLTKTVNPGVSAQYSAQLKGYEQKFGVDLSK